MMLATVALTAVLALPVGTPAHILDPVVSGAYQHDGTSHYVGEHYVKAHESIRKCITYHESRDAYNANTGTGKFRGAYQLSRDMGVGAGWMIQRDLRKTMSAKLAKEIGETLRATVVNKWHPYFQDYAFWLVWDKGNGKSHWNSVRWCFA
jgi:hypothetical protein